VQSPAGIPLQVNAAVPFAGRYVQSPFTSGPEIADGPSIGRTRAQYECPLTSAVVMSFETRRELGYGFTPFQLQPSGVQAVPVTAFTQCSGTLVQSHAPSVWTVTSTW
jgi:hypothetical protein